MKRFLMMSLLTLTAFALQAQTKEYAKSIGMFVSRPEVKSDKDTKMTSAIWHKSNMAWIKDHCEAKNVAIEKDYLKLFPEIVNVLQNDQSYIPMSWRLTEEKDETVLHCYLRMPADEVSNLFLASEETCLVDQETGAQGKEGRCARSEDFLRTTARNNQRYQNLWRIQLGNDGHASYHPPTGVRHMAAPELRYHSTVSQISATQRAYV